MYGYVENGGVRSGCGYMNIHNVYQHNDSKSLMNFYGRDYMDINDHLQNGDVSSVIGLLNIHTLPQYNK